LKELELLRERVGKLENEQSEMFQEKGKLELSIEALKDLITAEDLDIEEL
jgi:hypothetical protein